MFKWSYSTYHHCFILFGFPSSNSHALLLHFHDVLTIVIAENHCAKSCFSTLFVLELLFSSSKMRYSDTTRATMVVSMNGKGSNKSVEVIATMQQSNISLPIQLVSSKNNYMNEVMLPKQNSYFYDTTTAQNLKKYIFESSNCTVDTHNEYKTVSVTKREYILHVPWLCMLLIAYIYEIIKHVYLQSYRHHCGLFRDVWPCTTSSFVWYIHHLSTWG